MNLRPRDACSLKRVILTHPHVTSTQIIEKAIIDRIKKNKRCEILFELGSAKKSLRQAHLTKANILRDQILLRNTRKLDLIK